MVRQIVLVQEELLKLVVRVAVDGMEPVANLEQQEQRDKVLLVVFLANRRHMVLEVAVQVV